MLKNDVKIVIEFSKDPFTNKRKAGCRLAIIKIKMFTISESNESNIVRLDLTFIVIATIC